MATYLALGMDRKPLDPARRDADRAAHRAYLKQHEDKIICATAVFDDDREVCGSIYFLAAESREEVEKWLADDPFIISDLYESWIINEVFDRGDWWTLPQTK